MATYKHSLTGLAMLDCGQAQHPAAVTLPDNAQVGLNCSKRLLAGFVGVRDLAVVFDLDWCLDNTSWCQPVLQGLEASTFGFLVLCLADLAIDTAVLKAPVKAKPFEVHVRNVTFLQAAIGLITKPWALRLPFAAILPDLDQPLSSALRQLPGFHFSKGDLLLYNCPQLP